MRKLWGIKRIIGVSGLDFWIALISVILFILFEYYNIIDLNWDNIYFPAVLGVILTINIAFLGALYSFSKPMHEVNPFNSWLTRKNKDILLDLYLLVIFPIYLLIISLLITLSYAIIITLLNIQSETEAYLFGIPLFFLIYSYAASIYGLITIDQYAQYRTEYNSLNKEKPN
jgi:hypothetical protein